VAILTWDAPSGVEIAVGDGALYCGLVKGAMDVVASLPAVLIAVVLAVVGVARGDRLRCRRGWH
jgi:hypothetical protein